MNPLKQPARVTIELATQEDVIGLALRMNLDPDNLRHWYHEYRNKPQRIVPDVRFTDLFRILREIMEREDFSWDRATTEEIEARPDD